MVKIIFLKKKIFGNYFWNIFFSTWNLKMTTVHWNFCYIAMGQASILLVKHYMGPLNSIRALKWLQIWGCTQYKVSPANLLEGFGVSAVIVPQLSIMHIVYFNEI